MTLYYPGQRWLSETEIESGIGTVLAVDARTVTVLYRAVMETRVYAIHSAPLSRVRFAPGDELESTDGRDMTVQRVTENEHGVLTYHGIDADGDSVALGEVDIDHSLVIHDPASRLLNGQIDDDRWFTLRLLARQYEGLVWQSPVRGLQGARMTLVPHQLYIADRVARQTNSRALLADEVGLGKTIEACLILHRRIVQGQCERALIIVPPSLVNQWLVELLRRFNLSFSVYDEERCLAITESAPDDNPFLQAQFILMSSSLFENPERHVQALAAGWDMLIVDEAHHLHWSPGIVGDDYRMVEALARQTPSVLLLTATPEQLGRESHFARLRLLDPDRFNDLARFIQEEDNFEPVADLAEAILGEQAPAKELVDAISGYGIQTSIDDIKNKRLTIARQLVDLHGTSRLMFRNTRHFIKGFPERILNKHPLTIKDGLTANEFEQAVYENLLTDDPRIEWLQTTVRRLRPEKILLICSQAGVAIQLSEYLHKKQGIRSAAFHEGMTIIQRDRAAAWFAETDGAEMLLCSEIGSEGRNFQFAHHLILFDLPLNPDLLEQRIGRLDRIGQRDQVNIHVPYIQGSAHEVLFNWYQQATRLFQQPDPAAGVLYEEVGDEWTLLLKTGSSEQQGRFIHQCKIKADTLQASMQKGRERLLSLSSFDESRAQQIINDIQILDRDERLPPFMDQVFDIFGLDTEMHSARRQVVRPGDHMHIGHFPGVDDDGTLITYDRDTAQAHEDTEYLTWDHPMVTSAIDLVTSGEFGNSGLSVIHHEHLPEGTSLLELIYRVDCPAPAHLPVRRYISEPILRLLLHSDGHELSAKLPHEQLTNIAMQIDRNIAKQAIAAQAEQIRELVDNSKSFATKKLQQVRKTATQSMTASLNEEIQRLNILKINNPNIRDEDIHELEMQRDEMTLLLEKTSIRLDALRLIVVCD